MPLALVSLVIALSLLFLGLMTGKKVLKVVGVIYLVIILGYWALFFISNRG